MNQKRINKVLEKMEERGIDYLLVTDPVSIDYLLIMLIIQVKKNVCHGCFFKRKSSVVLQ